MRTVWWHCQQPYDDDNDDDIMMMRWWCISMSAAAWYRIKGTVSPDKIGLKVVGIVGNVLMSRSTAGHLAKFRISFIHIKKNMQQCANSIQLTLLRE